jgi:hypothetical protein
MQEFKVECQVCKNNFAYYKTKETYKTAIKKTETGKIIRCFDCKRQYMSEVSKQKRFHPSNPEDWVLSYTCGHNVKLNNYNSYVKNVKKLNSGQTIKCASCCQLGKKMSDEFKQKCRERQLNISDETKSKIGESTKKRYENMTPEELEIQKAKQSAGKRIWWDNLSEEEKQRRNKIKDDALAKMSPETIERKNKKISESSKRRMEEAGGLYNFKPMYNFKTIPYIEDILNVKYDTQFRHAESEGGEFKIYDSQERKFYYADAYCEEQNIWVEFDEKWHFKNGKLSEECQLREERIRAILDCMFLRINFNKKMMI